MLEDELEPEYEEDDFYEPMSDRHALAVQFLEDKLMRIGYRMRGPWKETCRLHATGLSNTAVAKKQGLGLQTIGKTLRRPDCQKYLAALQARTAYLDGPTIKARIHMLWRIAQDNEKHNPRASISAVDTINKTDGTYAEQAKEQIREGLTLHIINNFVMDPSQKNVEREINPNHTRTRVPQSIEVVVPE